MSYMTYMELILVSKEIFWRQQDSNQYHSIASTAGIMADGCRGGQQAKNGEQNIITQSKKQSKKSLSHNQRNNQRNHQRKYYHTIKETIKQNIITPSKKQSNEILSHNQRNNQRKYYHTTKPHTFCLTSIEYYSQSCK